MIKKKEHTPTYMNRDIKYEAYIYIKFIQLIYIWNINFTILGEIYLTVASRLQRTVERASWKSELRTLSTPLTRCGNRKQELQ